MEFIKNPLAYEISESHLWLRRDIDNRIQMIDNFVELIVFTPRGSFSADPDFGFEYWNYEYSNIHYREFNNGHLSMRRNGMYSEVVKKECQESIRKSLEAYEPDLKQVTVSIELSPLNIELHGRRKVAPKYEVSVRVIGMLDDGLGTVTPYEKVISFYMEPAVRRVII